MKKILLSVAFAATFLTLKTETIAQVQMSPDKNIVSNVSQSADFSTLAADLKTAGLDQTLQGNGPFTVFAPTNEAFTKLSATAADKEKLSGVLKYHIVSGKYTSQDIAKAIAKGNGTTFLTTLSGDKIIFRINENKNLEVSDEKGNTALVTTFDKQQSNGVIHVINNVLTPKVM